MTDIENMEAIELNAEELNNAVGGKYKELAPKTGFIVYQIQKGDNLNRISRAFGCSVKDILSWNKKITDMNKIYAGDYIYIMKK